MQGVDLLCSSWPHAAYVSNGSGLLQAVCIPLALQREEATQSLSQPSQRLQAVGMRAEELSLCSGSVCFNNPQPSPERNATSLATVVQV